MRAVNEFVHHCLELLAPLGRPRARSMFGGHGLYVDDLFIALVAGGRLYLKADEATRPSFEAAGCVPFEYATRDGRRAAMSYFSATDEAMESPALMQPWARLAMAAALRAANRKAPAATRSPRDVPAQAPAARSGTRRAAKRA